MKRILSFFLILSLLTVPVYAQSYQDFPSSDYAAGYLDGYSAGYNAGNQDGFKKGLDLAKQFSSSPVSESSPASSKNKSDFASGLEQSSKQVSASTVPDPTSPPEQSPPINGHIFLYPKEKRVAPLTIETSGPGYYYFSLTKFGSSKKVMSFFCHGGDTVRVKVPTGTYKLYFATGEKWYGEELLFGEDTVYQRCESTFAFYRDNDSYTGWTVTLYPVTDGNLETKYVSADDFPK